MSKLEDYMNKLTDMDWGWWPILKLRPAKNELIDDTVLVKITPVFGTLVAVIGCWSQSVIQKTPPSIETCFIIFVFSWVLFFVVYKFTFAYFWNKRARRLKG